ncbi:MAG: hypothetical protein HC880_05840 [Bacteroidia bacterium]|nr:hypothetical protein [Bacteroidia bacterium]
MKNAYQKAPMMLNKRTVRTQKRRVLRIIGLIILGMGLLAFLYRNQLLNLARNVKQNLSGVGTECRLSGFTW